MRDEEKSSKRKRSGVPPLGRGTLLDIVEARESASVYLTKPSQTTNLKARAKLAKTRRHRASNGTISYWRDDNISDVSAGRLDKQDIAK